MNVVIAEEGENISETSSENVDGGQEEDDYTLSEEETEKVEQEIIEQIEDDGEYTVDEDGGLVPVDNEEDNNPSSDVTTPIDETTEDNKPTENVVEEETEVVEDNTVYHEGDLFEVGGRYYKTLDEAINNYSDDGITLLADLDVESSDDDIKNIKFNTENNELIIDDLFIVGEESVVTLDDKNKLNVIGSLIINDNVTIGSINNITAISASSIDAGEHNISLSSDGVINTNSLNGNIISADNSKVVIKAGNTYKTITSLEEIFNDNSFVDNTIITLLENTNINSTCSLTRSFKIILDGHTLKINNNDYSRLYVGNNATLTIDGLEDNSKVIGTLFAGASDGKSAGKIVINGGTYVAKDNDNYGLPAIESSISVDAKGSNITASKATFIGGNKEKVTDDEIETDRDDEAVAALLASQATYDFTECTFDGATGVYVKGGTLKLYDCVINAYGNSYTAKLNDDRADSTGDAIVLDSDTSLDNEISLDIGGDDSVIESINGSAILEVVTYGND